MCNALYYMWTILFICGLYLWFPTALSLKRELTIISLSHVRKKWMQQFTW